MLTVNLWQTLKSWESKRQYCVTMLWTVYSSTQHNQQVMKTYMIQWLNEMHQQAAEHTAPLQWESWAVSMNTVRLWQNLHDFTLHGCRLRQMESQLPEFMLHGRCENHQRRHIIRNLRKGWKLSFSTYLWLRSWSCLRFSWLGGLFCTK